MFARIVKFSSRTLPDYAIIIFPDRETSGHYIDKNNQPTSPKRNTGADFKSVREAIATIKKFYHAPRKTAINDRGEYDFDDIRLK